MSKIPEEFSAFALDDSFNDAISPIYMKLDDDGLPSFGLLVEKKHCNFVGFCHGGVMMTFMDIALSSIVCASLGKYTSTPTVNSSFDFISGAKEGDWLYTKLHSVSVKRTMGFVTAMICGPNGEVARASSCFKIPDDIATASGMDADDYHQWRMS